MKARVEVLLDYAYCTYVALHAMYDTVHRALINTYTHKCCLLLLLYYCRSTTSAAEVRRSGASIGHVVLLPSCRFILQASGVEVAMCLDNWDKELLICWKTACGEGDPYIVGGARSAVQSGHPLLLLC